MIEHTPFGKVLTTAKVSKLHTPTQPETYEAMKAGIKELYVACVVDDEPIETIRKRIDVIVKHCERLEDVSDVARNYEGMCHE